MWTIWTWVTANFSEALSHTQIGPLHPSVKPHIHEKGEQGKKRINTTKLTFWVTPFTYWAFKLILKALNWFNNIKLSFYASPMNLIDVVWLLGTLENKSSWYKMLKSIMHAFLSVIFEYVCRRVACSLCNSSWLNKVCCPNELCLEIGRCETKTPANFFWKLRLLGFFVSDNNWCKMKFCVRVLLELDRVISYIVM